MLVDSRVTWSLEKNMCGSLQSFVMLLSVVFMPLNQISNMSLDDLRRRVTNCDKTQNGTLMIEPSVALDPRHRVSSSGAPLLSFFFSKKRLL
jgi:hypothetical protein